MLDLNQYLYIPVITGVLATVGILYKQWLRSIEVYNAAVKERLDDTQERLAECERQRNELWIQLLAARTGKDVKPPKP